MKHMHRRYIYEDSLVYSCQYCIVFCPKYCRPVLVNGIEKRMKELVLEKQKVYGYEVIEQEVMPDHVYLLLSIDPRLSVSRVIKRIKGHTAHELRQEFVWLKSRLPSLWTRSKFISTCGGVTPRAIRKYIENQKGM